ncbi:MAG: WYL domain-containing protein [Verrucomicrobia bacterium]|nr:WYL domain-containing protein [Verrucomicrobiota bacterium]
MKRPKPTLPATRPPLDRMMRIHTILQAGRYPNCTTLGQSLEVSTKTVQRDLEFMRDRLQLPLQFDPVQNGYHYTEDVESFPTLQITEGELFALMVAEKALQQYRGTPFEARLVGALKKLEQALPDSVSLNLSQWEQSITFRTTSEPLVSVPPILEALTRAAQRRDRLQIRYRKPGAREPEVRVVDPYQLANVDGDWYLFAFDQLRRAIRTFVPARILSVEPTGESFERPARFELEKLLRNSFGVHSREGDFAVTLRFEESVADYIREKKWHNSQRLTELPGGGVELKLQLGSLQEVHRWVLGWGGAATVVGPPELKDSVAAAAEKILGRT